MHRAIASLIGSCVLAGATAQQPSFEAQEMVRRHLAEDDFDALQHSLHAALAQLTAASAEGRAVAADQLLAILEGLTDDLRLPLEDHGGHRRGDDWRYREALDLRLGFARALPGLSIDAEHVEATSLALWLWRHGELGEERALAARALAAVQTPEVDQLFQAIVDDGCTVPAACCCALQRVQQRSLRVDAAGLLRLCDHFQSDVRRAAHQLALARGLRPSEFDTARSLGVELEQTLAFVGGLLVEPVPSDAAWGCLHVPDYAFLHYQPARDLHGWLLQRAEGGRAWCILTDSGDVFWSRLEGITFAPSSLAADAQRLLDLEQRRDRSQDPEAENAIRIAHGIPLDRRWMWENTWRVSPVEWFVSAWSLARGDRATAARLLLPKLQDVWELRDCLHPLLEVVAARIEPAMLRAFAEERDYAKAARLARLVALPELSGLTDQKQARELLTQLSERASDFQTLRLPTPAQWRRLQQTLSRSQQIDYLVARLRLLQCGSLGWNVLAAYGRPQLGLVSAPWGAPPPPDHRINPVTELLSLDLEASELRALAPALSSSDFILAYGTDELPSTPHGLHRVAMVAATICNEATQRPMFDPMTVPGDDEQQRQLRRSLLDYCDGHLHERSSERLAARMRETDDWEEVQAAFWNLHGFDPVGAVIAVRDVGRRLPRFLPRVVRLLALLDCGDCVGAARDWLAAEDPDTRFFAAVLLLRHGQQQAAAFAEVRRRLQQEDAAEMLPAAIDALLGCGLPEARQFLLELLAGKHGCEPIPELVQRLLCAGCREAFDALDDAITGRRQLPRRPGMYSDAEVRRYLLGQLGAWWRDVDTAALAASPPQPVEPVALAMRGKLVADWQRIAAGQRPTLAPASLPLPWGGLKTFGKGWVWNPSWW